MKEHSGKLECKWCNMETEPTLGHNSSTFPRVCPKCATESDSGHHWDWQELVTTITGLRLERDNLIEKVEQQEDHKRALGDEVDKWHSRSVGNYLAREKAEATSQRYRGALETISKDVIGYGHLDAYCSTAMAKIAEQALTPTKLQPGEQDPRD